MKKKLLDRQFFNQTIWDNIYNSLKALVDNCYYAQITVPPFPEAKQYLKEFCTVRMTTARASGHSTALVRLAIEYFDKVIFLSYNMEMARRLNRDFLGGIETLKVSSPTISKHTQTIIETPQGYYHFASYKSIDNCRGHEYEAVIVDGTYGLSQKKEDEIYTFFAPP